MCNAFLAIVVVHPVQVVAPLASGLWGHAAIVQLPSALHLFIQPIKRHFLPHTKE